MPSRWPAEALQAQAIAARSYAARRLRPGVSYYDIVDDSRAQVYRGSLGEKTATNAAVVATARLVLKSGSSIANTLYHSSDGGATENNENVFTSPTGAMVAGPVSYLRGSTDRRAGRDRLRRAAPYATWSMRPTRGRSCRPGSRRTRGRTSATSSRSTSRDRGVSGRLISVTLIGSTGTKTVSGEVFRIGPQRRATAGGPDAPEHALRHVAHPVAAILAGMPNERPRCAWAGADGPNPDPLMVAYHDDEWGTPGHDDIELFERLALESFQAGPVVVDDPAQARGVPGGVPRLRPARSSPAFDDDDRGG